MLVLAHCTLQVFCSSYEYELASLHIQKRGVMACNPAVVPKLLLLTAFVICLVRQSSIGWLIITRILHNSIPLTVVIIQVADATAFEPCKTCSYITDGEDLHARFYVTWMLRQSICQLEQTHAARAISDCQAACKMGPTTGTQSMLPLSLYTWS